MQSGPEKKSAKHKTPTPAHLCSNVGKRRLCSQAHAMNTSVPRTRCLRFLIYRARGCEHVFERLQLVELINMNRNIANHEDLLIQGGHFGEGHSMDLRDHTCNWRTRKQAIDHRLLEAHRFQAWCECWRPRTCQIGNGVRWK